MTLAEYLRPRRAGAMTAGEGYRPAEQAEKALLSQRPCQAQSQCILHHQQSHHDAKKQDQRTASCFQPRQIRVKADRGEESQHKRRLQCGIETNVELQERP